MGIFLFYMSNLFQFSLFTLINIVIISCSSGHFKSSLESARIAKAYAETNITYGTKRIAKKSVLCPFNQGLTCITNSKYRTFDGTCNNLNNPLYGAMNTPYKRFLKPVYGDGLNSPRFLSTSGASLPNPRKISTSILKDQFQLERRWFHIFALFGQFMVHDMTSLASSSGIV